MTFLRKTDSDVLDFLVSSFPRGVDPPEALIHFREYLFPKSSPTDCILLQQIFSLIIIVPTLSFLCRCHCGPLSDSATVVQC
jgi:hypothetical protein